MFRTLGKIMLHITIWILLSTSVAYSQESGFTCHFSESLTPAQQVELQQGAPILQDTTLRVAIFFVQFADYATNREARGSVGWNSFSLSDTVSIEKKYRYHHFWDMYFSKDTLTTTPSIHPDADSHTPLELLTYGSMRDCKSSKSPGVICL